MNTELFLAFLVITFVLIITPGPIVTLVIATGRDTWDQGGPSDGCRHGSRQCSAGRRDRLRADLGLKEFLLSL